MSCLAGQKIHRPKPFCFFVETFPSPFTTPCAVHGDGGTSPAEGWPPPMAKVFGAGRGSNQAVVAVVFSQAVEEGKDSSPAETSRRPRGLPGGVVDGLGTSLQNLR
jgi:hypothetical protein